MEDVQILMSTYNGRKYICEQIESILNQKNVRTKLIIRDDGSEDGTDNVIEEIMSRNSNRIKLIKGKNIGYRKSFLLLLKEIDENCRYFAFSDQDDVWEERKIYSAIKLMEQDSEQWLYASSLKITDEKLNIIYKREYKRCRINLGSFFVRTRLAGCTMVFRRELAIIARRYSNLDIDKEGMPDHDCLVCMLCLLHNKQIHIDNDAYILHRRTTDSETSGGKGIIDRIRVEINRINNRNFCYENTAKILIAESRDIDPDMSDASQIKLINDIASYRESFVNKIKLMTNTDLSCGLFLADLMIRIKILKGVY